MKEQTNTAADLAAAALEEQQKATGGTGESELDRDLPRMLTDRYRLERLIAKGGMGRVYLATQLPLERRVALKLLSTPSLKEDFRRRFFLEASVLARLSHPNIVVVHDYGEAPDGSLFMVMEYLDGVTLLNLLRQSGRLTPERALRVTAEVCRALRASHRHGVAHRDLKPGNIMLLPNKEDETRDLVKVLDFGLVKVFQDQQEEALARDLTHAEVMLGSPRYMAPEQIQCEAVDARADIYSMGVVLFAMLVGRPPFVGKKTIEILNQHLEAPVPRINELTERAGGFTVFEPEVGEVVDAIIARCMEKSPADRYQSMDELLEDLRAAYRMLADDTLDPSTTLEVLRPSDSNASALPAGSVTLPRKGSTPPPLPRAALSDEGHLPASEASITMVAVKGVGALLPRTGLWLTVGAGVLLLLASLAGAWYWTARGGGTSDGVGAEPGAVTVDDGPILTEVTISSTPAGAQVSQDGQVLGRTPLVRELRPGSPPDASEFVFQLEGYQEVAVRAVIEGEQTAVHADLTPVSAPVGSGGSEEGSDPEPPEPAGEAQAASSTHVEAADRPPARVPRGGRGSGSPARGPGAARPNHEEEPPSLPAEADARGGEEERGGASDERVPTIDEPRGSGLIVDDSPSRVPVVD